MRATNGWFRVAVAGSFLAGMSLLCAADEGKKGSDELKWDKLPKAVQEGMKKVLMEHLLAGETVKVGAFEKKGKDGYEVETTVNGKPFDFYVDADGKFAGNEGPEDEEAEGDGLKVWLGFRPGEGDAKGVTVGAVMKDSPASKAGLQDDDVIQSIGGAAIKGSGKDAFVALVKELGKYKPGDKVKVGVLRDGRQKELSVTLAERPAADEAGESDEGDEGDEGGEEGEGDEGGEK